MGALRREVLARGCIPRNRILATVNEAYLVVSTVVTPLIECGVALSSSLALPHPNPPSPFPDFTLRSTLGDFIDRKRADRRKNTTAHHSVRKLITMAALKHAPKSELQEEKGMPQKKVRQTISVSTLFKQAPDLKRKAEREVSNVLAPQPAGVLKQRSPMHTRKEYEHPLFLKFLGASDPSNFFHAPRLTYIQESRRPIVMVLGGALMSCSNGSTMSSLRASMTLRSVALLLERVLMCRTWRRSTLKNPALQTP